LKLSKRLKKIDTLVSSGYSHIWDCCCDHGFLGTQLITRQAAPHIHLVDIIPKLIESLELKLQGLFPHPPSTYTDPQSGKKPNTQWQTHCLDTSSLPMQQYSGKHLVIIAGVGGDLMTQFVQDIVKNNPDRDVDFLLCPVHHQFTLRQTLIDLNFSLKTEVLVKENQRFYEILLVSTNSVDTSPVINISSVGDQLWRTTSIEQAKEARDYLTTQLNHYQRMQRGVNIDVRPIIEAYQEVMI
jgi:tRNA (adenine22-N1)-methyltransferase